MSGHNYPRRLKPAATESTQPPREQHHRLPRECYRGTVVVAFTLCVAEQTPLFADAEVIREFTALLRLSIERHQCRALIYCFLPDHLHLLLQGVTNDAELWQAVVGFKQRSGYWLGQHRPRYRWQKDF